MTESPYIDDEPSQSQVGLIGRIPVRNLWLLMLYASDLFRNIGHSKNSLDKNPDDLPDLVAEILTHAVEKRARRPLSVDYRSHKSVLNRVRGRIDVLTTSRHMLLEKGMVACKYDALTVDTIRNQYVRAALEKIYRIVRRRSLAHKCLFLANRLRDMGVSQYSHSPNQISIEQFGFQDAEDRLMISAARLAFELALPTEDKGDYFLTSPSREEIWVRQLFEKGIGGFYKVVLPSDVWHVSQGEVFKWQVEDNTSRIADILPVMRTDIVLTNKSIGKRIVIDTKFTSILTSGRFRNETLKSGYIYQIYAYLRSQVGNGDQLANSASGLLLHPAIGESLDEEVVIQGHSIRFATVDFTASASEIRTKLLRLCDFNFD